MTTLCNLLQIVPIFWDEPRLFFFLFFFFLFEDTAQANVASVVGSVVPDGFFSLPVGNADVPRFSDVSAGRFHSLGLGK